MAVPESARRVAERELSEEQAAERERLIEERTRQVEERRHEERLEAEKAARRAAAKERADKLAARRTEVVSAIEEAAPALARLAGEYLALDRQHRTLLREADEHIPSGTAKGELGGYLAAVLGDYAARADHWGAAGSPPLRRRDPLCPDEGGGVHR